MVHIGKVLRLVACGFRRGLQATRDLVDRGLNATQSISGAFDEVDTVLNLLVGTCDKLIDFPSGIRGALRQSTNLGSNDSETTSGISRAGSFDAGIEGKKIGLEGDIINHGGNFVDLMRAVFQTTHSFNSLFHDDRAIRGFFGGGLRKRLRVGGFGGDGMKRLCQILYGMGNFSQCGGLTFCSGGKVIRGSGDFARLGLNIAGMFAHVMDGRRQFFCGAVETGFEADISRVEGLGDPCAQIPR